MTDARELLSLRVTWRVSAAWASKEIDCTLKGILEACGAACCKGETYWPARASGTGVCANLGLRGCTLGDGKPVTCLLYPFRLVGSNLVLHGRTLIPKSGYCSPCHRRGGRSIAENNRRNFALLFGEEVADEIVRNTLADRDTTVEVPAWVLDALEKERAWEASNTTPPGRPE